jgi:hypothetical protein
MEFESRLREMESVVISSNRRAGKICTFARLLWIERLVSKNSWTAWPVVTPGGHIQISVPMKAIFDSGRNDDLRYLKTARGV